MNNFFPYHLGTDFVQHWFNRLFMYLSPSGYGDFAADVVSKAYAPITASLTFSHRRGDIGLSFTESEDCLCRELTERLARAFCKKGPRGFNDPRYRFEALGELRATKMDMFRGLWEEAVPRQRINAVYGLSQYPDFRNSVNWEKFLRNYKIACCLGLFMPGSSMWLQKARKSFWSVYDYLDIFHPKVLQEWVIFFQEFPEVEQAYYDLIGEVGVYFGLFDMWCQTHRFRTGPGLIDTATLLPYCLSDYIFGYANVEPYYKAYSYYQSSNPIFYYILLSSKLLHPSVYSFFSTYRGGREILILQPPFYPFLPTRHHWAHRNVVDSSLTHFSSSHQIVKNSPAYLLQKFGLQDRIPAYLNFIEFLTNYYAHKLARVFLELSIMEFFREVPFRSFPLHTPAFLVPSNSDTFVTLSCVSEADSNPFVGALQAQDSSCHTSIRRFLYKASKFIEVEIDKILRERGSQLHLYSNPFNHYDFFRLSDYWSVNITQYYCFDPSFPQPPSSSQCCATPSNLSIYYCCRQYGSYIGLGAFVLKPIKTVFYSAIRGLWCPVTLIFEIDDEIQSFLNYIENSGRNPIRRTTYLRRTHHTCLDVLCDLYRDMWPIMRVG